ncbi:hypothetical protein V8073_004216 [Vibrio parahaemolyticus]|nr:MULTISPECIES: hypothetical protein [Vibrio]EIT7126695.1 hypothetical protein [Vibrio parahaemolyticus]EIT7131633.1 hypothetical protein [Vibrio parahaemolyticus]EIZ1368517.1 hypothetical protein [Vibrio parahaemolyticus]EIZ4252128.1 hypothetical protein [Vibrio parahaemolyticus]KNY38958.1 cysteinyl-tRNA synthetase [Vibrio harveyi]
MSRSYPLQSSLRGKLEQDFKKYRDRERLSDAEATRQLLTLALRIKLNDSDDDRPSNRELMEETYRRVRQVQGVLNLNLAHSFDGESYYKNKADSIEQRKSNTALVDKSVDEYLSGEKKG